MLDILLRTAYLWAISLSLYTAGWLLIKADKNHITASLASCQLLIIIWCIPQLFSAIPMSKGMKYLAYGISYVGISFIGPAWMEFAFLYSKRYIKTWMTALLFAIGALHYSVLLTNEYHHLFYQEFEVEQVIYGPVFYVHMVFTYLCVLTGMAVVLKDFRKNKVALAPIVVILLAAAVPLGFNLLYITGWVESGFDLTPPAFALSSLLMLLAVFRYDFLDINTMAFDKIFASITEGVAVYNRRGRITYCNEAVKRWLGIEAVETMEDLYCSLQRYGLVLEKGGRDGDRLPAPAHTAGGDAGRRHTAQEHTARKHITGEHMAQEHTARNDVSGEYAAQECITQEYASEKYASQKHMTRKHLKWGQTDSGFGGSSGTARPLPAPVITLEDGQKVEVKQYIHRDRKGKMVAGILLFTDVGRYYELLEQSRELAVSNQRLAIEQERNRIAQEVHDTAGHTLTMIQSLVKLMEIEYEKQIKSSGAGTESAHSVGSGGKKSDAFNLAPAGAVPKEDLIKTYFSQARLLTSDGIRQLRYSINNMKQECACLLISQSVYQLAGSVKEFEVEVEIQGEDREAYSYLSPVVYQCLREAITNCLKYAGATHMDVILKFTQVHLSLYIFDNGKGCASIEEGNGLTGIRERVDGAGGTMRILSGPEEGFQIYIKLPLS